MRFSDLKSVYDSIKNYYGYPTGGELYIHYKYPLSKIEFFSEIRDFLCWVDGNDKHNYIVFDDIRIEEIRKKRENHSSTIRKEVKNLQSGIKKISKYGVIGMYYTPKDYKRRIYYHCPLKYKEFVHHEIRKIIHKIFIEAEIIYLNIEEPFINDLLLDLLHSIHLINHQNFYSKIIGKHFFQITDNLPNYPIDLKTGLRINRSIEIEYPKISRKSILIYLFYKILR